MNTTNGTKGSKYESTRDLDIAAIAKLVRADIKAANIAGLKCSVKIERYAGGQSLNVRVTESPVQIWTEEFIAFSMTNPRDYFDGERYTAEASALLEQLNQILQAYNRDDSDRQADYFSVRFYGDASFGHDALNADRAATIARKVAETRTAVAAAELAVAESRSRVELHDARIAQLTRQAEQARISRDAARAELLIRHGYHLGQA